MGIKRISEPDLILPSLYLMSIDSHGRMSTTELISSLTQMLKPQGLDAEILSNRKDTYFSQIVRNLKSHDTLSKKGYASYQDGLFYITDKGRQYVDNNKAAILYIINSGFQYDDIKNAFGEIYNSKEKKVIPFDELIEEGSTKYVATKVYERSRKLRNAAIDYYGKNGLIACDCCGFEFKSFYGDYTNKTCIEIHHLKPIFQYSDSQMTQTIESALKNLLPVCPNCHRVIHRNNISKERIPAFKEYINLRKQSNSI